MRTLILLSAYCLCVPFARGALINPKRSGLNTSCRMSIDEVTASVFSESKPVSSSLFGKPRNLKASPADLLPGVHPRIAFNANEWARIVNEYAQNRLVDSTWARYFMRFTKDRGPNSAMIQHFAKLDTSAYTGELGMKQYDLANLANELENMTALIEGGIFMYTLHVAVSSRVVETGGKSFLQPEQNQQAAIQLVVNIAKIILSHYAIYGCKGCEYKRGIRYSDLWNLDRAFEIYHSWHSGLLGLAFSYDVLYKDMSVAQRRFVNSAIGLMVKGRVHWGINDESDRYSPNVMQHPHRIYSNWAIYHANLYLANLVIEHETEFDAVTSAVGVGFNTNVNTKVPELYKAYMQHAINPDGSSFEDGYTFNLAFREGSMGFIALARRGVNHLDTPRGRNMIHYVAQSYEPYRCGNFIGHSSGGGLLYHTFQVSFIFAFCF